MQTFLGNNYSVISERIALVLAFECGKGEKEEFTFGEKLKEDDKIKMQMCSVK